MSNPVLESLRTEVAEDVTIMGSATVLINGFTARLQAAVDAALANGATAAQLAPVTDEIAALKAGSTDLAAAVAANTPVAPATGETPPVDPGIIPTP